jgi:pimeloyl-ACP methyl ester carboxylesterase
MPYAMANGANLYYELLGQGEPMVLLGGSGFGRQNVEPLIPFLEDRFTLLWFDQRGYGQSDGTGLEAGSIEVWADDVPALMDAVGWETAHINSTSFGSMVALATALRHPDRCRSLVIQGFYAKPDVARQLLFEGWDDHSRGSGFSRGFAAHLAFDALEPEFLERRPEAVDEIAGMLNAGTPLETWWAAHRAMHDLDLGEGLTDCPVPTLVIAGELDRVTPLDMQPSGIGMRKTAELMPNARLLIFEGAGHVTILERTQEQAEAIIEFIAALADVGAPR